MEYKKKTLIWEDNNEPPKDYIWIKSDGKAYEFNYQTRTWVESKTVKSAAGSEGGSIEGAITYNEQELTESQKTQVRKNLDLYYEETSIGEKTTPLVKDGQAPVVNLYKVSDDTPAQEDVIGVIINGGEVSPLSNFTVSDITQNGVTYGYSIFTSVYKLIDVYLIDKPLLNVFDAPLDKGIYVSIYYEIYTQRLVYNGEITTVNTIPSKYMSEDAILSSEQELTTDQQMQTRRNLDLYGTKPALVKTGATEGGIVEQYYYANVQFYEGHYAFVTTKDGVQCESVLPTKEQLVASGEYKSSAYATVQGFADNFTDIGTGVGSFAYDSYGLYFIVGGDTVREHTYETTGVYFSGTGGTAMPPTGCYVSWEGEAISPVPYEYLVPSTEKEKMDLRKNLGLYYSTEKEPKTISYSGQSEGTMTGYALISTDTPEKEDILSVTMMSAISYTFSDNTDGYSIVYNSSTNVYRIVNSGTDYPKGIYVLLDYASYLQLTYLAGVAETGKIDPKYIVPATESGKMHLRKDLGLYYELDETDSYKTGDSEGSVVEKYETVGWPATGYYAFQTTKNGDVVEQILPTKAQLLASGKVKFNSSTSEETFIDNFTDVGTGIGSFSYTSNYKTVYFIVGGDTVASHAFTSAGVYFYASDYGSVSAPSGCYVSWGVDVNELSQIPEKYLPETEFAVTFSYETDPETYDNVLVGDKTYQEINEIYNTIPVVGYKVANWNSSEKVPFYCYKVEDPGSYEIYFAFVRVERGFEKISNRIIECHLENGETKYVEKGVVSIEPQIYIWNTNLSQKWYNCATIRVSLNGSFAYTRLASTDDTISPTYTIVSAKKLGTNIDCESTISLYTSDGETYINITNRVVETIEVHINATWQSYANYTAGLCFYIDIYSNS